MRLLIAPCILLLLAGSVLAAGPPARRCPGKHVVTADYPTLREIAFLLYGRGAFYTRLAKWNKLEPPYTLSLGQKLQLCEKPRFDPKMGGQLVLRMWRGQFDLPIAPEVPSSGPKELSGEPVVREVVQLGVGLFEQKKFAEALPYFQRGREQDPNYLLAWMYELRTLRQLRRKSEEDRLKSRFLENFPKMRPLPFFGEEK